MPALDRTPVNRNGPTNHSTDAVPFITGLVILCGALLGLLLTLLTLFIVYRRKRQINDDYDQLGRDSDCEEIILEEWPRKKRWQTPKHKESLSEKGLLLEPFLSKAQEKSVKVENTFQHYTPRVETHVPITQTIAVQSDGTATRMKPDWETHDSFMNNKLKAELEAEINGMSSGLTSSEASFRSALDSCSNAEVTIDLKNDAHLFFGVEVDETVSELNSTLVENGQSAKPVEQMPRPLPEAFPMPDEASSEDGPANGLLAFSLSLRRLSEDSDPISLLVHVFEARCILTGQVGHDAWFGCGIFYVKARFRQSGIKASPSAGSVTSLDQRILMPNYRFPKLSSLSRSSGRPPSIGRTKAKVASRTVRFLQTIELAFPKPWQQLIDERPQPSLGSTSRSLFSRKRSISMSALDTAERPAVHFELALTLKQQETSQPGQVSHRKKYKHFQAMTRKLELGSVRVPCTPKFWQLIAGGPSTTTAAPECATLKPFWGSEQQPQGSMPVAEPGLLRMVKEISQAVTVAVGSLNIALQWNQTTLTLTCRAIDCNALCLPLGAKEVFVSYCLMNNTEVLEVRDSRPAVKIGVSQCEFYLADDVFFKVSNDIHQVCLGVAVVTRFSGLKNSEMLLGRLVLGPDGLAYGSGLRHWNEVSRKRGMIRRKHWLI